MSIRALLADGSFSPEDIATIMSAFEDSLRALRLADRTDPAVNMVAKRTFEIASVGVRDPILLRDAVLESFKADPGVSGL